jgi:hypothetical protein
MEIEQALCLGAPPIEAMATLVRIAKRVTVVASGAGGRAVREWSRAHGARNVLVAAPSELAARQPADLVWVVDRTGRPVDGLVAPGGSVYEEGRAARRAGMVLHLAPLRGEAQTAVPRADAATLEWFAGNGLLPSSFDVHALKRLLHPRGRRRDAEPDAAESRRGPEVEAGRAGGGFRSLGKVLVTGAGAAEAALTWHRFLRGLFARRATLSHAEGAGPPRWLRELALGCGVDIAACRWGLAARGKYGSRKVLFFLWDRDAGAGAPRWIVKLPRDAHLNGRIENLVRALETLHRIPGLETRGVPVASFHGRHAGLAVVAESAMEGAPFAARSRWNADCAAAANAVEWLGDLAAATATPVPAADPAAALRHLFEEFTGVYELRADERAFLEDRIDAVARATAPFPLVFQHGDPGTWNLLVDRAGRVVFLDWEAAEPSGMPLWDLFYFMRSFAVGCGRVRGRHGSVAAIDGEMLADAPVGRMLVDAVRRYCERAGLDPAFVEPLFHTCWMHRALKEATRLTRDRLATGHYLELLRAGIARRGAPTLRRLFAG